MEGQLWGLAYGQWALILLGVIAVQVAWHVLLPKIWGIRHVPFFKKYWWCWPPWFSPMDQPPRSHEARTIMQKLEYQNCCDRNIVELLQQMNKRLKQIAEQGEGGGGNS